MNLHNADFYGWTREQASRLKSVNPEGLDVDNLIDEIEALGNSELSAFESRLIRLLQHLLKWHYQPGKRTRSWQLTIKEQRKRAQRLLAKNPSFKHELAQTFAAAYESAVNEAYIETDLPDGAFPEQCPWTIDNVLTENWLPNQD